MSKKSTRQAYGEYLAVLAEKNKDIVVLDADLSGATNTSEFKKSKTQGPHEQAPVPTRRSGNLQIPDYCTAPVTILFCNSSDKLNCYVFPSYASFEIFLFRTRIKAANTAEPTA